MIRLDRPDPSVDRTVLDAKGGFLWWYAEVLDAAGNGAVVIWSYGLPFLPGYKSAALRGQGEAAGSRPSVNVALYKEGTPAFYLLRELDPEDVYWEGTRWTFGENVFTATGDAAARTLTLHLSCPVAGTPNGLKGTIQLTGPTPRGTTTPVAGDEPHGWCPLILPATGTVDIRCGDFSLITTGNGYHDRNLSHVPLHGLGIDTWVWGHTPYRGGERIFYVLFPESGEAPRALGFQITPEGALTEVALEATLYEPRRTGYGMPTWSRITLDAPTGPWLEVHPDRCVDSGPFYLRYLTRNVATGEQAQTGSCEIIVPSRIDLARHRPLVRMRVSRSGRSNSMWLPLFEGDPKTRVGRLMQHWRHPMKGWFRRGPRS